MNLRVLILRFSILSLVAFPSFSLDRHTNCNYSQLEKRVDVYTKAYKELKDLLKKRMRELNCGEGGKGVDGKTCDHNGLRELQAEMHRGHKENNQFFDDLNERFGCSKDIVDEFVKNRNKAGS